MGLFDWLNKKKRQNLVASIERHTNGKFVTEGDKCERDCKCDDTTIQITKATTDAKATTVPSVSSERSIKEDMDRIEANVEKRMAIEKAELAETKRKAVSKSLEKRIAIQKDLEDTPVAKKPVSKKTVPTTEAKKAPVKKVTKPVAKEAPKAQSKPAAKKPAPKKK